MERARPYRYIVVGQEKRGMDEENETEKAEYFS